MSIENISFYDSFENYLPIYFHFLDGFLNPSYGYKKDKLLNFLYKNNNNLIPQNNPNIYYLNFSYNYDTDMINLKFHNCKDTPIDININKDSDINIQQILPLFSYCICQINANDHATSLLIYNNNKKLNVLSFNSGLGIDMHETNSEKYLPYYGIQLDENIESIKKILSFLLLNQLYNISEHNGIINDGSRDYCYINPIIIKIIDLIKEFNTDINFNDIEFEPLNIKDYSSYSIISYNNINTIPHKTIERRYRNKVINILTIKIDYILNIQIDIRFYKILINLFGLYPKFNFIPDTIFYQTHYFNTFNSYIKNNIILHHIENKLYITEQKSGSCTWFSIYWPLIYYNVFNNNYTEYCNHVTHIYDTFILILNRIFTLESFNNLYLTYNHANDAKVDVDDYGINDNYENIENDSKSNDEEADGNKIQLVKNICSKLINIELIDQSILLVQNDKIYESFFNISDFYMSNITDNLKKKQFNFENNTYKYIIDTYSKINNQNEFYISVYELYKQQPHIFNIRYLVDNDKIDKLFSNHILKYLGINAQNQESKERILNLLKQFSNVTNETIPESIYINKYIYIALFFNYELDDIELINFIKFMHKLNLFLLIYIEVESLILSNNLDFMGTSAIKIYYNKIIRELLISLFNNPMYEDEDEYIYISIKYIFDDINYISHFLGEQSKIILKISNDYSRTISDYKKLIIFLCENPKYIHQDFNNNNQVIINNNLFIKLNQYFIFKNDNYRNNLINFYGSKYFEGNENLWVISNLQLLMIGCVGYIKSSGYEDIEPTDTDIIKYNLFIYNYDKDIIPFDEFKIKISENKKKFIDKNTFCDFLISKKDDDEFKFNKLLYLTRKYLINMDNYTSIRKINFNNNLLDYLLINKTDLYLIKNTNDEILIINYEYNIKLIIDQSIVKVEPEKVIHDETTNIKTEKETVTNWDKIEDDLLSKKNWKSKQKLFKQKGKGFDDEKVYDGSMFGRWRSSSEDSQPLHIEDEKYKINKIYFNDNLVEKFENIIYPFKYIIPTNCLYFIYKVNGTYHVTYFIKKEVTLLLGNYSLETGIYTITINKNNQMYPNNNDFKLFSELCENFGVNYFNILYVNINIERSLYLNDHYYNLFYKDHFFIEKLESTKYHQVKLLQESRTDNIINLFNKPTKITQELKYFDAIKKLLFKISICEINNQNKKKIIKKFEDLINSIENDIHEFTDYMKDINIYYLFDNDYSILYNYLSNIKIYNTLVVLKNILINNPENFCSQTKIYYEQYKIKEKKFNYKFEALFELIMGSELFDEQMNRYVQIIGQKYDNKDTYDSKYNNLINYNQSGGYPLHHFMMGKGKSAVITPLLSLYYKLMLNKRVYIIVPSHLVDQTKDIIECYAFIFKIKLLVIKDEDKVIDITDIFNYQLIICSDSKIKELFLLKLFTHQTENLKSIMLIDEFDSILDPIKSNFNIVINSSESMVTIYNKLKNEIINDELIKSDIKNILNQIESNILVENINWGIHPTKLYAIPFRSKDNPLLKSNFSSGIITVYLTLYYFKVIHNYEITNLIINYIINNKIFEEYFKIDEPQIISIKLINNLLPNKTDKIQFFEYIFIKIFSTLYLTQQQFNTSFVDILNIDEIFKIGYSGTLNIDLPPIYSSLNKFNDIEKVQDHDEKVNIEHAILESTIIKYSKSNLSFFEDIKFDDYDAIIDTIGLFKNEINESIALKINKYFDGKRDIIFIDEKNKIYIIKNDKIINYNQNSIYIKPFIYYDQAHIVGVDIKQDFYPNMNGLCIVNDISEYTTVAQSMCRLRKLNMGHIITFIYLGEIGNVKKLLKKFIKNEQRSKQYKYDNLIYQTLKSEIRKSMLPYNKYNYMETVKFYFLEKPTTNIYKILYDDVCEYNKQDFLSYIMVIRKPNNIELFKQIDNITTLKKLVYNIGSLSIDQNKNQDNEQIKTQNRNQNQDTENYTPQIVEIKDYDYKSYNFTNLDNYDYFNKNTIKINDNIRCLHNIFSQANHCEIQENNSGFLFILFEKFNNLLIVPGYLITHFYDNYHVFNYKLDKINLLKNDVEINCFIDSFKNLDFFKILLNITFDISRLYKSSFEGFILYMIITIINKTNFTQLHINFIRNYQVRQEYINIFKKPITDSSRLKYLKYKNKYLTLKNIV